MLLLLYLGFSFFFLSNVVALNITVQSNTIVGQPSPVMWARKPSDGDGLLVFDLRFINPDNEDIGLALGNIQAAPSTEFGTAQVVFPSPGSYLLVAVSVPDYNWIGESGQVNAFQVPSTSLVDHPATDLFLSFGSIPTSKSQAVPSILHGATSSAKPASTSSGARRKKNFGAIIGGTLGGVAFLGLAAALVIVFLQRHQLEPTKGNRRWTFHRDKMVRSPVLDIRRTSPIRMEFSSPEQQGLPHDDIIPTSSVMMTSPSGPRPLLKSPYHRSRSFPLPGDIEQQGLPHDDIIPTTSPVVMMASPTGTRPLPKSPYRPLPFPPLKPHQQDMAVLMEQIRNKMTELEKNPGPTQHIILDDLQKQMNWLKSQF